MVCKIKCAITYFNAKSTFFFDTLSRKRIHLIIYGFELVILEEPIRLQNLFCQQNWLNFIPHKTLRTLIKEYSIFMYR